MDSINYILRIIRVAILSAIWLSLLFIVMPLLLLFCLVCGICISSIYLFYTIKDVFYEYKIRESIYFNNGVKNA